MLRRCTENGYERWACRAQHALVRGKVVLGLQERGQGLKFLDLLRRYLLQHSIEWCGEGVAGRGARGGGARGRGSRGEEMSDSKPNPIAAVSY